MGNPCRLTFSPLHIVCLLTKLPLLPNKRKPIPKHNLLTLWIKGFLLIRIFPHVHTPKLPRGFWLLRGEVQKLGADPSLEFRCTGNISHHFNIKTQLLLLHSSICKHPTERTRGFSRGHWSLVGWAAPARCNECIHCATLAGKGEGIAWFADTELPISIMALELWVCIILPEFKSIWCLHLDTSLFLCQIVNSFCNQHGKNITAVYIQTLYRKMSNPKSSENRIVKIQDTNI